MFLGCGTGLVGIVSAIIGLSNYVTLTDLSKEHEVIGLNIRSNIKMNTNFFQSSINYKYFPWTQFSSIISLEKPDIILGADVLYDKRGTIVIDYYLKNNIYNKYFNFF